MRLRPFIACSDFDVIKNWILDERTHAMWCANLIAYPIEKENFASVMEEAATRFGDSPYVATTDDGNIVGFFCYSNNTSRLGDFCKSVLGISCCLWCSKLNGRKHAEIR